MLNMQSAWGELCLDSFKVVQLTSVYYLLLGLHLAQVP